MDSKNKGLPEGLDDGFKGLPVAERIDILIEARELLEEQRERKGFSGDCGGSREEGKERRKS